jgi:hypothetical protein
LKNKSAETKAEWVVIAMHISKQRTGKNSRMEKLYDFNPQMS